MNGTTVNPWSHVSQCKTKGRIPTRGYTWTTTTKHTHTRIHAHNQGYSQYTVCMLNGVVLLVNGMMVEMQFKWEKGQTTDGTDPIPYLRCAYNLLPVVAARVCMASYTSGPTRPCRSHRQHGETLEKYRMHSSSA